MKKWINFGLWLCIVLGVLFRFYNLRYTTEFTFDQEYYLAKPAKQILIDHDLVALGAKTGVGNLFIGPLYIYLGAIFFWLFHMDPIAGSYLSGFLACLTLITAYFFLKKSISLPVAFMFTLLWFVSPFVLRFDRSPINLNLLPISALLIISGLFFSLERKIWLGGICAGLGVFIGVNSHFTSVFLIIAQLIFFILKRKIIGPVPVFLSFLGLIVGLLPLVVFDFTHDFLIGRNLITFLNQSTSKGILVDRFWQVGIIIVETTGRIFLYDAPKWLQLSLGIFVLAALFYSHYAKRHMSELFKCLVVFLAVYWIGFSLYKGPVPDYYFLGLLVIICINISSWLIEFLDRKRLFMIQIAIAVLLLVQGWNHVSVPLPKSLGVKQEIIKAIKNHAGDTPITLQMDIEYGWQEGLDYLVDYYGVNTIDDSQYTYIVSYPRKRFPEIPDLVAGDMALGYPETVTRIRQTKDVQLYGVFSTRVLKDWSVLSCPYVDFDMYLLTPDIDISCAKINQESQGIIIAHLPECTIWEIKNIRGLDTNSSLPFITVSSQEVHYSPVATNFQLAATATERQRCFVFADLKNPGLFPLSADMKNVLTNLRNIH